MQKPTTIYERHLWYAAPKLTLFAEQISIIRSCSEVDLAFFRSTLTRSQSGTTSRTSALRRRGAGPVAVTPHSPHGCGE